MLAPDVTKTTMTAIFAPLSRHWPIEHTTTPNPSLASQRAWLRPDHVLFCFESSMSLGVAERILLENLALQIGLPILQPVLPHYLSGEEPDMIDQHPELAILRDIVFLFKVR